MCRNYIYSVIVAMLLLSSLDLLADAGDTLKVRTIEFQARRAGWFDMPTANNQFQRIMMNYKLKCPPGKPCGEWDYTAHVYVSKFFSVNFRVDKSFPEKISFMNDTSFTFDFVGGEVRKTPKQSMTLYLYNDAENPTTPSDTIAIWPTYYTYNFNEQGKKIDSTLVDADQTLERVFGTQVLFNDENTYQDDYEIMRYITPYGNGIDLGEGYTWVMDVTDFAQLLSDKVFIHAPCGGWGDQYDQNTMEDLELTFDYIEGTPPRDLIATVRLWNLGHAWYNSNFEDNLPARDYTFSPNEKQAMLRIIQSGHGFGASSDNCAEFCKKDAYVKVDGAKKYTKSIWRECGDNPLYPQGGTWIIDRSNWCPGAEIQYHDYDLTEFIQSGQTHSIDYDMQSYNFIQTNADATPPYWLIRGYLMTYGEPNFQNDARFVEIKAPNADRHYNRMNPTVGSPIIVIQNSGSQPIEKISFRYGNDAENMAETAMELNPPLKFMETRELILPQNDWYQKNASTIFNIEITSLNDTQDEYEANNKASIVFSEKIDKVPTDFTIDFTTNNSNVLGLTSSPYTYKIYDLDGNIVFEKKGLRNSTTYSDNFSLPKGEYSFIVENTYGYGFGFWFYASQYGLSNANLRFTKNQSLIKSLPIDWGNYYRFSFSTDYVPTIQTDVDTEEIDFGKVDVGESAIREIKIFPENEKGLVITEITLPFATNKKFSILKEESTSSEPRTLQLGDTLTLTVEFLPLSKGSKTSSLQISSNDKYNSPISIQLIGQGNDPTSIEEDEISIDLSLRAIDNSFSEVIATCVGSELGEATLLDYLGNKIMCVSPEQVNRRTARYLINTELLPNGVYLLGVATPQGTKSIKIPVVR